MTVPAVNLNQLDGALGVLPASSGKLLAVIGAASQGPFNTPASFGRPKSLIDLFGVGPGVEAAALHIERTGKPVVFVRTETTNAGAAGEVTQTGTGTSEIGCDDSGSEPLDDYEVFIEIVTGGSIGTAGITFRWSLDGGRNMSPVVALGTATSYTIPNSGVKITFSTDTPALTLVAGDTASFRTTAPKWNGTELADALDALGNWAGAWEIAEIVGPLTGNDFDVIESKFQGFFSRGKFHAWMGHFRVPNEGEDAATYKAAFDSEFGSKATTYGAVCSGAGDITSAVSGRKYLRPHLFATASREAASSEEVNQADVNLGPLVGVSIKDENGNPKHHDEALNPGLDDSRSYVLRTWGDDLAGVYVNRPRLLSPQGSDFELMPHRRVMNVGLAALRTYFIRRLNSPILVDKNTGFILEEEALEIEEGAYLVMAAALLAKPKASAVQFALSRTDNLLSTKELNGDARIIPLGYAEFINLTVGFLNPALQVQAV